MASILLVVIYIAFISLGLPDALLGSAWPSIYKEISVPVSYAGIISMIISGGTIISSLFSNRLIQKLGTGMVTVISVAMTAAALFGFAFSGSFVQLCLWGIPYGLGAGSVDAALNNFVALHYKSRHMSWLHCFWGIGATLGPYIMGFCLVNGWKWNSGYQVIGIIQVILVICLLVSLPLWRAKQNGEKEEEQNALNLSIAEVLKLRGAKAILTAFFCYCALESTAGLWASSYMVLARDISTETAAKWTSLFYFGITIGRFLSGFVSEKFSDKNMVRIGQAFAAAGVLLLFIIPNKEAVLIGLILVGFGCAPIYPSLLHATPDNFGADKSQAIMGMQMACAYVGSTFMPPIFGILTQYANIKWYPLFLMLFIIIMLIMVERVNKKGKNKNEKYISQNKY